MMWSIKGFVKVVVDGSLLSAGDSCGPKRFPRERMDTRFVEYLDAAWPSFRQQLLQAHEQAHRSSCASIASPTMQTALAKPSIMKKATRSLTFDANILGELEAEAREEEEEEAILAPPSSKVPALLMVAQKDLHHEASEKPQADSVSSSAPTGPTSASGTASAAPTPANSPEGTNEPTVSSDESRQSRSSRRSKFSVGSESVKRVGSDLQSGGSMMERTLTQQTLDSQVDHTAETLRARLGVRSGMVSGKILHDAAVALGLTRFSEQDVNLLVNRLAAA
eukprot:Skav216498  [mRNA]  locus=scaffold1123:562482:564366:- [translate_table: standard]